MSKVVSKRTLRIRRSLLTVLMSIVVMLISVVPGLFNNKVSNDQTGVLADNVTAESNKALDELNKLTIKGRAPKSGYSRAEFGDGWADVGGCDMRNIILKRGMSDFELADDGCVVLKGTLNDPYTGATINFIRGSTTSDKVQIDHVVALSDAWQKGAQNLSYESRVSLANDPLELLAVDGPTNQKKGDGDAASWLPPNKEFRCQYVARQIAVKSKYSLWVTEAEKAAMGRVLNGCREQVLPIEQKK